MRSDSYSRRRFLARSSRHGLAACSMFALGSETFAGRSLLAAFSEELDDPATDAGIIQYVSTFVPKMSGKNFNPHVSTGVAPKEYLDTMLLEPFKPFTFSPAGAAVYQLGPFGTAAKKLKEWDLKP